MSKIFNTFYFAVVPSEAEGSRKASLKLTPRDPSTSLGMTCYSICIAIS